MSDSLEVEIKMKDSSVEDALEAVSDVEVPSSPHDFERDIFIRWSSMEPQDAEVLLLRWMQCVIWSFGSIDQVWIEDIETVAVDDPRRKIFDVVVPLVVLGPLVAQFDSIVVVGLSRLVSICPVVALLQGDWLGHGHFEAIVSEVLLKFSHFALVVHFLVDRDWTVFFFGSLSFLFQVSHEFCLVLVHEFFESVQPNDLHFVGELVN